MDGKKPRTKLPENTTTVGMMVLKSKDIPNLTKLISEWGLKAPHISKQEMAVVEKLEKSLQWCSTNTSAYSLQWGFKIRMNRRTQKHHTSMSLQFQHLKDNVKHTWMDLKYKKPR